MVHCHLMCLLSVSDRSSHDTGPGVPAGHRPDTQGALSSGVYFQCLMEVVVILDLVCQLVTG